MEKLKILGSSIFMLGIAAFFVWCNGPDLLHDIQHMGDETEYADGTVTTSLGVEGLWNRIGLFALVVGGFPYCRIARAAKGFQEL